MSRLRLLRVLALALGLLGTAGAVVTTMGGGAPPAGAGAGLLAAAEDRAEQDRAERLLASRPAEEAPAPAPAARRSARIRVVGPKGGEASVVVRALDPEPAEGCYRALSEPARTDGEGWADLSILDPAPDDAVVEVARMDEAGFRHAFAPLDVARETGVASLPAGGSLRVEVRGFPPELRPRQVTVEFLAPYADCESMFADVRQRPSEDGGVFECRPNWRTLRLRLTPEGVGVVPSVPTDHAITVSLGDLPDGWLVEGTSSTGPFLAGRTGDVLRVPEGGVANYVVRVRPIPTWTVRVRAPDGSPVAGARVAAGVRNLDGTARLLGHSGETDAAGAATVPLWAGSWLPGWTPPALVAVVIADGRRARLVQAPGRWDPAPLEVVLEPGDDARFSISGRLLHPDERPGAGLPLRLVAAHPWNGHAALPEALGMTDGDGRFGFSLPENWRAVFEEGGGVSVALDLERLEGQPRDAFWRMRWPELPRLRPRPERIPLPARGGTATVELRLAAP